MTEAQWRQQPAKVIAQAVPKRESNLGGLLHRSTVARQRVTPLSGGETIAIKYCTEAYTHAHTQGRTGPTTVPCFGAVLARWVSTQKAVHGRFVV